MRYNFIALFLACLFLLSACGAPAAPSAPEQPPAEPEAFGISLEETPEQAAEITQAPEISGSLAEGESSETVAEEFLPGHPLTDLTEYAIRALVLCDYLDNLAYSPEDMVLFWRAMGYYIDGVKNLHPALTRNGDVTELDSADLGEVVPALFGNFSGDYPAVTEEDPFVTVRYEDGREIYQIREIDTLGLEFQMEFPDDPAGNDVQVQLLDGGEPVATYRAGLGGMVLREGATEFFYCVTGLERE